MKVMNMTNSFNQKKLIVELLMQEPNAVTEQQFERIFDLLAKAQADDRFDVKKKLDLLLQEFVETNEI